MSKISETSASFSEIDNDQTSSTDPLTSSYGPSSVFEMIELVDEEEEWRDVDCYLERLDITSPANIILLVEIIVGFLALFSTDTLSAFGGNVNYLHWSCGVEPSELCLAVTDGGMNYSKATLCMMKERNPLFQLEDDGASFLTEFGMICEREKESKVLVDVSGIGSGAGFLLGGLFCDMFGRRLGLKLSSVALLITVIMTILADSIQFFTLCLFMQGFTTSMTIISFLVLLVELLPHYKARLAVCLFDTLRHVGVLLAFGMREVTQKTWRGFALCLLILDLSVVAVTMHIPASPRFNITCKDQYRAKHSLNNLGIKLGERSEITIPKGASEHWAVMNFFKHRRVILEVFLLYTLWAIVGTTSNVPAGKVWKLVSVVNAQYCIKALVDLCGVPIACIIFKYNVALNKAMTGLGWSMIVCYFIGIIPLGGGVFTVENIDGYCSEVILQAIRVVLLLTTIESSPTSQRGMFVGGAFVVELSFRKIGSLLVDIVISDVTEIIYGVLFLVFVYVTSFLTVSSEQKLVNTLEESKLRNLNEQSRLLSSSAGLNQIDLSFLK